MQWIGKEESPWYEGNSGKELHPVIVEESRIVREENFLCFPAIAFPRAAMTIPTGWRPSKRSW